MKIVTEKLDTTWRIEYNSLIGEPLKTEHRPLDEENLYAITKQMVLSVKCSTVNEHEFMYRYVSRELKPLERYTKRE